jgi:plastocyanin
MRFSLHIGGIFALVCAATMVGCGESPAVSPSTVNGVARTGIARDDAPAPTDPAPAPAPADPAPAPTPATITINIIGSSGNQAYTPNPGAAAVGDLIVWTNNDKVVHRIVLDDGTFVGDVMPGQSTPPIPLKTATATYHCDIHPSMIGGINFTVENPPPPPNYGYDPPDPYGGYY